MAFNKRFFGEGMKDGGPDVEEKEHIDATFTALVYTNAFYVSDYMPCLIWLDLDGHEKLLKDAIGIIKKYQDPIIEERLQQWRDGTRWKWMTCSMFS
ncbi:conserved hypothetical protein [Ricinus communis]|uniref:Cytochrome P450 n=1 Tax=Ricinus communis TaxID=3988 RepID=B9S5E6_RICCO|nr:conserved hypothetical protein [Ricinus communis]